jgi:protein O-GlcNAc transferase
VGRTSVRAGLQSRFLAILFCTTLLAQKSALETAWDLVAKGQRTQAVSLLRDLIAREPRNADAHLLLGNLLMEAGDRAGSIAQLTEAVKLRPRSADAHNSLGEAYNRFGDQKAAQPEFERAVALDPRNAQAHISLGAILVEQGNTQAAAAHLDTALRLLGNQPDAAYPRYLRAKIYADGRDYAKAAAELEKAVALKPDFAEAWSDLGEAKKNLFDDEGTLAAFRKAVELAPDDDVARTRFGSKLLDLDKAHEAVVQLQAAVRLDPKNQTALNALQLALRRDGQTEQADAVKKRLTELLRERDKSDQTQVAALELNNRGAALEKSGDLKGAVEKYRAALALFPEHSGIRTNLGIALLKLGQWDEGLAALREALRRDPNNAQLKAALDDALAQYEAHRQAH